MKEGIKRPFKLLFIYNTLILLCKFYEHLTLWIVLQNHVVLLKNYTLEQNVFRVRAKVVQISFCFCHELLRQLFQLCGFIPVTNCNHTNHTH